MAGHNIYRINRAGAPPVYKRTLTELRGWCKRNPSEMESWDELDPLEELDRLQTELE